MWRLRSLSNSAPTTGVYGSRSTAGTGRRAASGRGCQLAASVEAVGLVVVEQPRRGARAVDAHRVASTSSRASRTTSRRAIIASSSAPLLVPRPLLSSVPSALWVISCGAIGVVQRALDAHAEHRDVLEADGELGRALGLELLVEELGLELGRAAEHAGAEPRGQLVVSLICISLRGWTASSLGRPK